MDSMSFGGLGALRIVTRRPLPAGRGGNARRPQNVTLSLVQSMRPGSLMRIGSAG